MTTTTAPHPFYIPIRECESCDLHKTCTAPTPPVGNTQARVMFVGEAPGYREDLSGVPWTGPAGTLLNDLLASVNLERDHVWLTNTVKCRPPEDRDPNPREINTCRQWLDMEVDSIKPQIVVTLGGVAARAFGLRESMDHQHGIPVENVRYKGYTIPILLPVYHPAFGLHQTSRLRQIFDDFAVLGRLLQGVKPSELHVVDEYPNPTYREHPGAPPIGDQLVAVDAETIGLGGKLWSVQISDTPGTGTFIKASAVRIPNAIVHNYLYDARYIQMDKYADTMVMAWLLGLPQGLKTLALVRCGMKMQDLSDILRPHQVRLSLDYLEKAALIEWGKAPPYPATEWINKLGRVDTRTVNPRSINTKIATVIKNTIDKGENPWSKWKAIKPQERVVVESQMGLMQEASLADIPRDEAIYYSCRDPDAIPGRGAPNDEERVTHRQGPTNGNQQKAGHGNGRDCGVCRRCSWCLRGR
jgi:uracil-DNA glycosylase family 4